MRAELLRWELKKFPERFKWKYLFIKITITCYKKVILQWETIVWVIAAQKNWEYQKADIAIGTQWER